MRKTLSRIEKLELANKDKISVAILAERCRLMVEKIINNPQPNRKIEDYAGDGYNK